MMIIIKKMQYNWEGKAFSKTLPAQVYPDLEAVNRVLEGYYLLQPEESKDHTSYREGKDITISIKFLSEKVAGHLLSAGKIRF